mgnify:CR=1 FL=1
MGGCQYGLYRRVAEKLIKLRLPFWTAYGLRTASTPFSTWVGSKCLRIRWTVLNRKLRRFLRTSFKGWHKRKLLAYMASLGPNIDLFNYYWRPLLLRLSGVAVGESTAILSGIQVSLGELSIGNEVFINVDCRLACGGQIFIGNYCQIGARVSFETVSHQ